MPTSRLRLGQLLVDARMITAAALDDVLVVQRTDGRRLGTLLVERGLINETQLTQILSHQLSVPWVSLLHIEFSRQLLNLVPREVADRFCLVPIYVRHVKSHGDALYVAMDDPSNEEGLRACQEHAGLPVRAMIAPPSDIRGAIRVYYGVPASSASPNSLRAEDVKSIPSSAQAVEASTKREPAVANAATGGTTTEAPPTSKIEASEVSPTVAPEPVKRDRDSDPTMESPVMAAAREESSPSSAVDLTGEAPQIDAVEIEIPAPRGRAPKMVALTLLDGTTIRLPARRQRRPLETAARPAPVSEQAAARESDSVAASTSGTSESDPKPTTSAPPSSGDPLHGLTARDLVLALRVVANGADASEVLGENVRWEALFSALLSLLLKKHLIADWEFVDELKKQL